MPGGGSMTVRTCETEINDAFIAAHGFGKEGRYAVITVTDTGTGMDERVIKKIFEPFFTTKGVGKGTGFGLSIVYDIVKQHRGYVTVTSTPGKGSTFEIYVPLLQSTGREPPAGRTSDPDQRHCGGSGQRRAGFGLSSRLRWKGRRIRRDRSRRRRRCRRSARPIIRSSGFPCLTSSCRE